MTKPIDEILVDCWRLMEDHEPDGWPAVQLKTITALCDEVRRLTPAFEIGEEVGVFMFSGEFRGQVVSRSEHKTIGPQYAVFATYPHGRVAEWASEDMLYKLKDEDCRHKIEEQSS